MKDVIENLIGLIPALLSILWILRIISKRRKSTTASSQGESAPEQSFRKPVAVGSAEKSGIKGIKKRITKRLPNPPLESLFRIVHDPITGASRPMIAPAKARRKDVPIPEKLPSRSRPADKAPDAVPLAKVKDTPNAHPVKHPLLTRIDSLPPLQRAMVWSFILEKPSSIKDG